jgi:putative ABC transport system substrate-binding protein
VRRREFVRLLGSAAAASSVSWPLAARAQQPTMPVIGFINSQSLDAVAHRLRGLHQGLKETGFVEGENVTIAYRFAENQNNRLPELAADLVRRQVAVIVTSQGIATALAIKAATTTIPIVFGVGDDPVKLGLVASLARPGGNATGINFFSVELAAKRLDLLRELVPGAARMAMLFNPTNSNAETTLREVQSAARAIGLQIQVVQASTSREIEAAFATFMRERPDALFVASDGFFSNRRVQLANLSVRHAIPAVFSARDFADAGGLASYGASMTDAARQIGVYAGRILKGAKPADLPVVQSTKLELVINAQTARMFGLTVPQTLLATADEVIE